MAVHLETGRRGEEIAKAYLAAEGYDILEQNWRCRRAEVDLIAFKKKTLVFVEVKTRSSIAFGEPEEFVTETKQARLRRAAEHYIYIRDFSGEIRFDIISILLDNSGGYTLNHIEDAFWG